MAPRFQEDRFRDEAESRFGRGGRPGPSRRRGGRDREWEYDPWDSHHRHHHHEDHHHEDHHGPSGWRDDQRGGEDALRGAGRRLLGATRAAARSDSQLRDATLSILDQATRAIYRLLADAPIPGAEAQAGPDATGHPAAGGDSAPDGGPARPGFEG